MNPYAYPGVFESLCCVDPLVGVCVEHTVDEVLCFWGHRVPLRGRVLAERMEEEGNQELIAAFDNNTGVTVSHSGDGYWQNGWKREVIKS